MEYARVWTHDKVFQLIDLYKSHQCLWYTMCVDYKSSSKKILAIKNIAFEMGCSQLEIKKKLESLTASFRREKNKVRQRRLHGDPNVRNRSKWFAYKRMAFLLSKYKGADELNTPTIANEETEDGTVTKRTLNLSIMQIRLCLANFVTAQFSQHSVSDQCSYRLMITKYRKELRRSQLFFSKNQENAYSREGNETVKFDTQNSKLSYQEASDTCSLEEVKRRLERRKRKRLSEPPTIISTEERDDTKPARDSDEIFGEHVASKLKKYSERVKCIVQHKISNILFEADMGKLSVTSSNIVESPQEIYDPILVQVGKSSPVTYQTDSDDLGEA